MESGNAGNAEKKLQEELSDLLLRQVNEMYKCMNCGKETTEEEMRKRIRCPFCGYRILVKNRTEVIKKVKAR